MAQGVKKIKVQTPACCTDTGPFRPVFLDEGKKAMTVHDRDGDLIVAQWSTVVWERDYAYEALYSGQSVYNTDKPKEQGTMDMVHAAWPSSFHELLDLVLHTYHIF